MKEKEQHRIDFHTTMMFPSKKVLFNSLQKRCDQDLVPKSSKEESEI